MTKEKLSYGKYLQLENILDAQAPKSKESVNLVHDEMCLLLFIKPMNYGLSRSNMS